MKEIPLTQFEDELKAAEVYDEAAKLYFGEYARPNRGGN